MAKQPPGGVAQKVLLIPVSSSELGVVCGGEEQNDEDVSDMSMNVLVKHAVRLDDFYEGAQVCNTSQSCLEP